MHACMSFLHTAGQQDTKPVAEENYHHAHDLYLCLCLLQLESSDDDSIGNVGPKAPASSRTAHAMGLNGQAAAHPSAGTVNRIHPLPAAACVANVSCEQNKLAHAWLLIIRATSREGWTYVCLVPTEGGHVDLRLCCLVKRAHSACVWAGAFADMDAGVQRRQRRSRPAGAAAALQQDLRQLEVCLQ